MSKIYFVNAQVGEGYFYQVSSLPHDHETKPLDEDKYFVSTKKEAIKILNDNNHFECKGCGLFWSEFSLPKEEHYCESLQVKNKIGEEILNVH